MSSPAEMLEETALRGELHHAIILHGPSRDSLRATALGAAKRLTCPIRCANADCPSCRRVERGIHPDVHLLSVAADRKLISIEQVRESVIEASLRPYEGRGKVFIVEQADAMSPGAANSLLKVLEEPTADTTFVLLTRSADLLLPTIRSRCQSLYIGPLRSEAAPALPGAGEPLQRTRFEWDAAVFGEAGREWEALAGEIIDALKDFAVKKETARLLELAATLAEGDGIADRIGILTAVLRDLAALDPADTLEPAKAAAIRARISTSALLEAASLAVRSPQRLVVNSDARMVLEQIVLALATT